MSDIPPEIDYSDLCSPEPQPSELIFESAVQKLLQQPLPEVMLPMAESLWSTLGPKIENSMRKVVKEELEEKFNSRANWMSVDETHPSKPRNLALKFSSNVLSPVYSGQVIKGDSGDSMIRVSLVDGDGNVVKSGPEASLRVKLMVILDSGSCGKKPRMPLVVPNRLKLSEGTGVLDTVALKRKASKWAHVCKIKLVARSIVNGSCKLRAETEPFSFGDCRGARNKKHYPPSLSDAVWRLKEITRNGRLHKRLRTEKINSVEQFLISYNTDPLTLQQMLGIGIKQLNVIVNHAKTCEDIPENLYSYYSSSWERKVEVIFDGVRQVRGLLYKDHRFVPADDLGEDVKADARQLVRSAFENWENVQPYADEASTSHFPPRVPNEANTYISDRSTLLQEISSAPMWSPLDDYASMGLRGQTPDAILDSTYRGNDGYLRSTVNLRPNSRSSGLAKERWKMVNMSIGRNLGVKKGKNSDLAEEEIVQ